MRWICGVVLTGCLATAGPSIAYRPCSHETAVGWKLSLLHMAVPDSPSTGAGIAAGQTYGSDGHDTFFAARAAIGSQIEYSLFEQGFDATAELGLSLHDWEPGVFASASPMWVRALSKNGEVSYVFALDVGVRRVSAGWEIYVAPSGGVLLPPLFTD